MKTEKTHTPEHDANPSTWWGRGVWPTCICGFAPRDNGLLNAHWAEHGFRVVDEHGRLTKRPLR